MNIIKQLKVINWISIILLSSFLNSACTGSTEAATDNLADLVLKAESFNTEISGITLSSNTMCTDLKSANVSMSELISDIDAINAALSAPTSITIDDLQSLDNLGDILSKIANSSTTLSLDLTALNSTTDQLEISNALSAMLSLSDDIGTMANRIVEMSDKILIMADNIGVMADRIIVTQEIQSANLAATQASILMTQQNSLALVSVINSNIYNSEFDGETLIGNTIADDISTSSLTQTNMADEWARLTADVSALKNQILASNVSLETATTSNTLTIDAQSYVALADMSIMVKSISIAFQGQALATESLASTTQDSVLSPSLASMLQMSADIGVMADNILEMADLILAMADNIGLTADQIVAAQQLQSDDYASTLAAVDDAQITAINIIVAQNL